MNTISGKLGFLILNLNVSGICGRIPLESPPFGAVCFFPSTVFEQQGKVGGLEEETSSLEQ